MLCPKCQVPAGVDALFCGVCGTELPPSAELPSLGNLPTARGALAVPRFQTGEQLMGRYQVLGDLGQGGMGIVYRCRDEVGGIEVALKSLPPELSHNRGEMEEVRENFQLVCQLAHPNIATVRTLEKDAANGNYYLILELVEGVDLRKWRKQKGGAVTLEQALPVLRQVAAALDYAHSRKIIHRDIKPSNVMVATDGTAKVLDFGLAAQIQSSLSRVSQVHFSTSGTGPYMAPEQWRGLRQDAATDQYALAVLAYELLSGHLPFESSEATVLQQAVLNTAPEQPEGLSAAIWTALQRGLAKNRADRYASCAALVEALGSSRGHEAQTTIGNRQSKMPMMAVAIAALLLLCLGGWVLGVYLPGQRQQAEAVQRAARIRAENAAREQARLVEEQQRVAAETKAQADAEQQRLAAAAENLRRAEQAAVRQAAQAETARQARLKAESDDYAILQANPTEPGMTSFLEHYPEGAHAAEIQANLTKFQQDQAAQKEEYAAYVLLQANLTGPGMVAFLARFPDGTHAQEINAELLKFRNEQAIAAAVEARHQALINSVRGNWELKFADQLIESQVIEARKKKNLPQGFAVQMTQDGQSVHLTGRALSFQPFLADFDVSVPDWNLTGTFQDRALNLTETRNYPWVNSKMNETLTFTGTLSSDGQTVTGTLRRSGLVSNFILHHPFNETQPMTLTRKGVEPLTKPAVSHFSISGEVTQPGTYSFSDRITLTQAIQLAGGFTGFANTRKILINHEVFQSSTPTSETKHGMFASALIGEIQPAQQTKVDYNSQSEFEIVPKDVIEVPKRFF